MQNETLLCTIHSPYNTLPNKKEKLDDKGRLKFLYWGWAGCNGRAVEGYFSESYVRITRD